MMNLLIVDDEKKIRKGLLSLPWDSIGIGEVYETENGARALELLGEHRIDVVISDIKMPGLSGLELAEHIKKNKLDIAVILLTGFSDFNYAQQAIHNQVVDYLLKPLRPGEILNVVAEAMKRLEQSRYQKKVVRQYEIDTESLNLEEETFYLFKNVNPQCREILLDMSRSFAQDISLNSMAQKYHFSPAYLSRMIKKETGYLFSDLLKGMRLTEAVSLIREENMKISLVCEKTGFRDSKYFSQLFKKVIGCSPHELRGTDTGTEYTLQELLIRLSGDGKA